MKLTPFVLLNFVFAAALTDCGLWDAPDQTAQEWIQAFADHKGNKIADRTCLAQQANIQEAGPWSAAFNLFGRPAIDRQPQTDVSGLTFTTISGRGTTAIVRVTGRVSVAFLDLSQTQNIDETWRMVQESGKWKWCGESGTTSLPKESQPPSDSVGFTNLSASMPKDGPARFNFTYGASATSFHVDVSTFADMSWDVYLTFATGNASPLVEPHPTKWAKYSCGQPLYWRVINDWAEQSPIQNTTVTCPPGAPPTRLVSQFFNLSASMPIEGPARFDFDYDGSPTSFHVDVSTLADMTWDVYLTFAAGRTSPLVEPHPNKWAKYTCGQTLYWRIVGDATATSPIQSTIVNCN